MRITVISLLLFLLASCKGKNAIPAQETIAGIDLKRGEIVVCGPADKQFGSVDFETSCSGAEKKDFDLAMALLHSFEYDEAEKVFAKVIDASPGCAMAYWGVAMSNFHPLWSPPTRAELEKGDKAIAIAVSLKPPSKRESDYISAIAAFYKDWSNTDHRTRTIRFEKAMEKIYTDYPNDKEAATFYSLALTASADPTDKSFANQKKAGAILKTLYPGNPDHPGVVHYIIHAYDSPELAPMALDAARKYASVAPSSAHALHMPSHVFTRLGLWTECITSNLASVSSAQCYAEQSGIKGHWDEEMHGLDYLMYAYLQKGENEQAQKQWDYFRSIKEVSPVNFKVAYAFASIPSRYLLENRQWKEAASLVSHESIVNWEKFPWQRAIIHYTRALGAVHTGRTDSARAELKRLKVIHDTLLAQKDMYKANQLQVQVYTTEAWILFKEGENNEAINLMTAAADMEDKTQKLPVTPGEMIPARELLGDMLFEMKKYPEALAAYEADLKKQPNRFNGLYGAGIAAERSNNKEKARSYYQQLLNIANSPGANRAELVTAKAFLEK